MKIEVIPITKRMSKIKAYNFYEDNKDLKIIKNTYSNGKDQPRTYYMFVKLIPSDKVCLDRTISVEQESVRDVFEPWLDRTDGA